uniref:Rpr2-domain-containing protein n=1 Tax=Parastrongyloides trichosuri TaxID=131310 RepID=A0A0N4ZLM8_PARTI
MSIFSNELPTPTDEAEKRTVSFLRTLSNNKKLPPILRSHIANKSKQLSTKVYGSYKNGATKFHCFKCNVQLDNSMIDVRIRKVSKKRRNLEMKCKGCNTIIYNKLNEKKTKQRLPKNDSKECVEKEIIFDFDF